MSRITIDVPDNFLFSTEEKIRITDLNYGNHLANDAILSIIHEARVRFLANYKLTEMDIFGAGLIMSDSAIIYKSEGFYGATLKIEVGIKDFTKIGCDMVYRLTNKETLKEVAIAKTGIVFFDYSKRKISPVPEQFIKLFKKN